MRVRNGTKIPRIFRRPGGPWRCEYPMGWGTYMGYGSTPAWAYRDAQAKPGYLAALDIAETDALAVVAGRRGGR